MKIKGYSQFILENFNSRKFDSDFNDFMNIYQNEIVPEIGEVEIFTNHMLDGILDENKKSRFHKLRQNLKEARSEFVDTIKSLSYHAGAPVISTVSFSSLASKINSNPDEDVEEMQKILDRAGFTLETLKKLFNPVVSVFTSESFARFIEIHSLDEENGYVDIYLYKLNEKLDLNTTVWLGGAGWGDALNDNPEEEYVVKYSYGYHKTPYGKMLLDQMNISKESFVETAYLYLKDWIIENVSDGILRDLKKMTQIAYGKLLVDIDLKLEQYIDLDDDRFIIRYSDLCDDFNKVTGDKYSNNISPEWFKESILANMSVIGHLNIQDTGEELIFNE
jgi:hypothetical protein